MSLRVPRALEQPDETDMDEAEIENLRLRRTSWRLVRSLRHVDVRQKTCSGVMKLNVFQFRNDHCIITKRD